MTAAMRRLQAFFFAPIPDTGIGMMRAAWGFVTFFTFLFLWKDIPAFYSDIGFLPLDLRLVALRGDYVFSVLYWVVSPEAVYAWYLVLLCSLLFMTFGIWPRFSTIVSVLLVFSFHERNPLTLGGGDTVLRFIGFVLLVSPSVSAFSLQRVGAQWRHWKQRHARLPPTMIPIWPYRLLLWQFFVLYSTSLWFKLSGQMWREGTAVASTLHHPIFLRFSPHAIDFLMPAAAFVTYSILLFHALWLLLLIPRPVARRLFPSFLHGFSLKRLLLLGGLLFHGGIFFFLDAGNFSLAVFTGYLGLLLAEDFEVLRKRFNIGRRNRRIAVLFDGHCGLCERSMLWLMMSDWLRRLRFVDFHNDTARKAVAPDLTVHALDKALHIRHPDPSTPLGTGSTTLHGFDAFRDLASHLPPFWPLVPFLWLPGMRRLGRRVYARIARRRSQCTHGACRI